MNEKEQQRRDQDAKILAMELKQLIDNRTHDVVLFCPSPSRKNASV